MELKRLFSKQAKYEIYVISNTSHCCKIISETTSTHKCMSVYEDQRTLGVQILQIVGH